MKLFFLFCAILPLCAACAESGIDKGAKQALDQKLSIELVDTPLKIAVQQLAKMSSTEIVLDGMDAKAQMKLVSLKIKDVSLREALARICSQTGLKLIANEKITLTAK